MVAPGESLRGVPEWEERVRRQPVAEYWSFPSAVRKEVFAAAASACVLGELDEAAFRALLVKYPVLAAPPSQGGALAPVIASFDKGVRVEA